MSSFGDCLRKIEQAIDDWVEASEAAAASEAEFKAFEASSKKAYMGSGDSAVLAETKVRASKSWSEKYLAHSKANTQAEASKQRIRLEQARFEAARSVYSATKKAVG